MVIRGHRAKITLKVRAIHVADFRIGHVLSDVS